MKKLIALTVVLTLLFSLAACGGGTAAPDGESEGQSSGTQSSSTADVTPEAGTPPSQDTEKLVAEEIERMRAEEETRLTALPKLPNIETGEYEIIEFGGYDWRVLDIVDDRVLLISDKILMDAICNPYFSTILTDGCLWEEWELREYLNGEFYNSFSESDRAKIVTVVNANGEIGTETDTQDNIFLLNTEEAVRYFGGVYDETNREAHDEYNSFVNRIAHHVGGTYNAFDFNNNPTEYTVEPDEAHEWWLRSPGQYDYGAALVGADGTVNTRGQPVAFGAGIRPALWMRLESSVEIAPRTVTVLPSATNDAARLSAGDTVSTGVDAMELLLNSQSVLKMDESTNVTIDKVDAFSLSLIVESGAVFMDITRLRDDDNYEITVGDMTLSVIGTQFAVENNGIPRIIMLEGSGMVNGTSELSFGRVATVENGEIMFKSIVIDESLSTVSLAGILANENTVPLTEADYEKAIQLLEEEGGIADSTTRESQAQPTTSPLESLENNSKLPGGRDFTGVAFFLNGTASGSQSEIGGIYIKFDDDWEGELALSDFSDFVLTKDGSEVPFSIESYSLNEDGTIKRKPATPDGIRNHFDLFFVNPSNNRPFSEPGEYQISFKLFGVNYRATAIHNPGNPLQHG